MLRYMIRKDDHNPGRALVRKTEGELAGFTLPSLIAEAGPKARKRFLEFFAAQIRNPNTRMAYARAVGHFLHWCERRGVSELNEIQPMLVAGYIEQLQGAYSKPTVKQYLAAVVS